MKNKQRSIALWLDKEARRHQIKLLGAVLDDIQSDDPGRHRKAAQQLIAHGPLLINDPGDLMDQLTDRDIANLRAELLPILRTIALMNDRGAVKG